MSTYHCDVALADIRNRIIDAIEGLEESGCYDLSINETFLEYIEKIISNLFTENFSFTSATKPMSEMSLQIKVPNLIFKTLKAFDGTTDEVSIATAVLVGTLDQTEYKVATRESLADLSAVIRKLAEWRIQKEAKIKGVVLNFLVMQGVPKNEEK